MIFSPKSSALIVDSHGTLVVEENTPRSRGAGLCVILRRAELGAAAEAEAVKAEAAAHQGADVGFAEGRVHGPVDNPVDGTVGKKEHDAENHDFRRNANEEIENETEGIGQVEDK